MNKVRIAFFAEVLIRDYDGATRTIFEIIDRIDSSRFEFLFFCGTPPNEDVGWEVFHVPTVPIPFNKDYKMASMFMMGPKVEQRLREFDPDVIHVSTPSPLGYFALKYALRKNIAVTTIYHTHFISYVRYYTKNTPMVTSFLECALVSHNKSFYNRCYKIYVPTGAMAHELSEFGFNRGLMSIWPRGINLSLFSPDRSDKAFIQSITKNGNKNIFFASRLVWEKNLETLCNLYDLIQARDLPYNLVIAGDGLAREELKSRMPHAHLLGHADHDELCVLYASSDYFVFTSDTETFGNVIIEAMASGLPSIIADGGGSRSLINHGVTGYKVEPTDAEAYLEKIELLENDANLKATIINNALADVQQFSWDTLVDGLLSDYEEVSTPIFAHGLSA